MNREAYKLARDTLRMAVKDYGWSRTGRDGRGYATRYTHGPGKFEGEHWSIVHFYNAMLNDACTDEAFRYADCTVAADIFEVSDVEREAFKLESDTSFVALWYSDSGFVSMQELTCDEYDNAREAWERDHSPGENAE